MAKRLIKVATELNVGTSTLVEFLKEKGFDVENKPTAKVSEEMEELLYREFQKDLAIKQKADQMVLGNARPSAAEKTEERPASPVADILKKKAEPRETPPPVEEKQEAVTEKKPEPPKVEEPVVAKKEDKPKPQKETPEVSEKAKTPPPKAVVMPEELKKEKEKTEEKPKDATKKEAPQNEARKEEKKEEAKPTGKKEEKQSEVPKKPAAQKSTPPAAEAEKKAEPEPEKPEEKADETIRAEGHALRGLKIMGKIDVSKAERKPGKKAEKKKAGEKKKEKKSKPVASSDSVQPKRKRRRRVSTARGGSGRGSKKEEAKEVISQKEIEEKIKATMARISSGGKKKSQKLRRDKRERLREKQELREQSLTSENLQVTEFITVQELANLMEVEPAEVITVCMNVGIFAGINQRLEKEIIELVAEEFGYQVEFIDAAEELEIEEEIVDAPEDLESRPPIITVMGHVDHGKTSLLDYIRKSDVTARESGGITQHIGAYEISVDTKEGARKITFLDTPGHEAFTAMRARGAKVTDIAIIIIAADDSIMPQTREAISHAQAAGVPLIFAINKVDKPGAKPERIKQELAAMNLLIEEWGGEYQSQEISAKTGQGVPELLEKILLVADLLELKANPNRKAIGTVLEASLDKGRGYLAKLLVQNGTLRIGSPIVAGQHAGKIKALYNEYGTRLKEAGPSTPVLALGLHGAPQAGERFKEMETEQEARALANRRAQIAREQTHRATKRLSLDEIGRRIALGEFKELNLIVKGDVDGSVEALADSFLKLSYEKVQVNIIHKGVGQIVESDVLLASASDAIIVGFQVKPSLAARKLAEREHVQIRTYSVIYEAINEIKDTIHGMLAPTKEEHVLATLEVQQVFKIRKVGMVAGCVVQDGKITRDAKVRVIRNGLVIFPNKEGVEAELGSLKRFQEDVKEVKAGQDCGLTIKNFNDVKVGDVIEAYEIVEVEPSR